MNVLESILLLAAGVAGVMALAPAETASESSDQPQKVLVSKCCDVDSLIVEAEFGASRECVRRADLNGSEPLLRRLWSPVFFDLSTETEVPRPSTYEIASGIPKCDGDRHEVLFPVFRHEHTIDDIMLLKNGSLAHRLQHESAGFESETEVYASGKYCVDDMVITHNVTGAVTDLSDELVEFAYICVSRKVDVQTVIDVYVYPVGLCVSIFCLVLTFLLYSFLPQLRDLSGKFILGICAFQSAAFALLLVDLFGWKDTNVHSLAAELSLHACVVGIWLCLNCMGHHIWKIILSKSVFTRVTDGQRLCYYSIYVACGLLVITSIGVSLHFFARKDDGSANDGSVGWECLAGFYVPVSLILLVNVFFYWTAQRRMARQMLYNKSMQHFQVNFDLYIKFLLVVGVWWLFFTLSLLRIDALVYISRVFDVVQGPLVFCVAMCRTRVAFLFKRYFCLDGGCCAGRCCDDGGAKEFIDEADGCREMAVIDRLRERAEKEAEEEDEGRPTAALLSPIAMPSARGGRSDDMSRSLFNVRGHSGGGTEVHPPSNGAAAADAPLGRVKRLLKSNSLTAIANINWGWRKETSV